MAYNYFPATYPYQQMYPATLPVAPQTTPAQNGIVWVSGEKEAAMYPIAPNNAVALWSQSEPIIYLKQADASGKPTIKIYDIVERTERGSEPAVEFATKSDLAAFSKALEDVRGELETMRGDVYGIAGKRKTVKKTEEEE